MHLYTKYQKQKTKRWVLKKNLDKIGIRWQRQPEKKLLAKLPANKGAKRPLQSYLKDMELGNREEAAKVTKNWGQRSDQEREKQLENFQPLSVI